MNKDHLSKVTKKRGRPFADQRMDRAKVLEAAAKIFGRAGYQGARLKDIAAEAKITSSLLHYHFDNKEDLWEKTVMHLGENLLKRLQHIEGFFKDLEGLALMKAYNRQFIYFSADHPEFYKIVSREIDTDSARSRWLLERVLAPLLQMAEQRIKQSRVGRELLRDISLAHFFSLLIGSANIFFTHTYQLKTQFGVDPFEKAEIERYADFVNETIFARFESADV